MRPKQLSDDATVMTPIQVSEWLQVRPRQLDRMGVPSLKLGRKTVRYLREDVARWLEEQRPKPGHQQLRRA